jgi:sec-independent protein translocase protein TatA
MFGLGATELAIILAIVIVLFGARRLPEIGAGVGKAIKNFRAGMSGKDEIDVTPEPESAARHEKQGSVTDGKERLTPSETRQKTES